MDSQAAENKGGIVHFEILPKNINKVVGEIGALTPPFSDADPKIQKVQATHAVEGDVATNLALLLPHVNEVSSRPEWFEQIDSWKKKFPFDYDRGTPDGLIKPQTVIEKLSNLTADKKDRTIITTGVGQHQMVGEIRTLPSLFVMLTPKST